MGKTEPAREPLLTWKEGLELPIIKMAMGEEANCEVEQEQVIILKPLSLEEDVINVKEEKQKCI